MEVTKKRPKQKIGSELNLKATKKRPTQKIAEGTKGKVFAVELSSTDRRVQNGENIFRVEKEATIGRSPDCDIVILDEYVSRKHAQIFIKDGKAYIKDLLSSNGTFFQERPVLQQMQIEEDGTLRVDTVEFNIKTLSV
ncbi:MAG TPA: FHA domain-containing protein [Phaeodactylibacter sp.]|nr:FHA domain-containing protein [Phaeodactylibacter sp.]